MRATQTLPVAVILLVGLGLMGCVKGQDRVGAITLSTPLKSARTPTAEEKKNIDEQLLRPTELSARSWRNAEKQGVLTIEESKRLWKVGAYIQSKYAVSDEDVDFVLRLLEKGPRVDTDSNRSALRMRAISSLMPGRLLSEAQQRRAIKVIGPIANDPPKEKIVYIDGIQSSEISIQLTAIAFLSSTRHPEALALLQNLGKTTQVKGARKRIDENIARLKAR